MVVSADRLAAVKRYIRVEGTEEDELIYGLCRSGMEYLQNAGISEPMPGTGRDASYQLALDGLVLDWYDHRGDQVAGALHENPALRRLINQLKLTEPPVSNLDTGRGGG